MSKDIHQVLDESKNISMSIIAVIGFCCLAIIATGLFNWEMLRALLYASAFTVLLLLVMQKAFKSAPTILRKKMLKLIYIVGGFVSLQGFFGYLLSLYSPALYWGDLMFFLGLDLGIPLVAIAVYEDSMQKKNELRHDDRSDENGKDKI